MSLRLGYYRFALDLTNGPGWRKWLCTDQTRGSYGLTPWGAFAALCHYHRQHPRGHWPDCDGHHHRGAICPGH